jgi:hypothetical protein
MVVTALETMTLVTEQYSAWRQQCATGYRAVLERTVRHHREANRAVSFLEWPVLGTR